MDLNYLYHRHGVASYMARHARCERSREAHGAFARLYSARIDDARRGPRDDAA